MKIYVYEEGSCRGHSFGGRYIITLEDIEQMRDIGDDEDALDDFLCKHESSGSVLGVLFDEVRYENTTYDSIITKLKNNEFVGVEAEESEIGLGSTKELAKEGYLSIGCPIEREWPEE